MEFDLIGGGGVLAMVNLLFQVPELRQRKACVTGAVNMVKLQRQPQI